MQLSIEERSARPQERSTSSSIEIGALGIDLQSIQDHQFSKRFLNRILRIVNDQLRQLPVVVSIRSNSRSSAAVPED